VISRQPRAHWSLGRDVFGMSSPPRSAGRIGSAREPDAEVLWTGPESATACSAPGRLTTNEAMLRRCRGVIAQAPEEARQMERPLLNRCSAPGWRGVVASLRPEACAVSIPRSLGRLPARAGRCSMHPSRRHAASAPERPDRARLRFRAPAPRGPRARASLSQAAHSQSHRAPHAAESAPPSRSGALLQSTDAPAHRWPARSPR
jgi:hypothetical protein